MCVASERTPQELGRGGEVLLLLLLLLLRSRAALQRHRLGKRRSVHQTRFARGGQRREPTHRPTPRCATDADAPPTTHHHPQLT